MVTMYDPKELEINILKFWGKNKIFQKLVEKNKNGKTFSFLDGPITANNPMGVHHAWGRTYKDLFSRFKAMQGFSLRYQNGFDSQGLWIEREVEKSMNLKTKEDIEKFGIENFAKECKKRVEKFSKMMTEDSIRLGQWMDWDNSYFTMTDTNNLHNWHLLKIYHEKGLLYKGKDVVPWCPRCGTASSKHDIITEGYKKITHNSVFLQFPLKDSKNEYLLVWTTTPWTVPADIAVAVNPKLTYVKVEQDNNFYWLVESRTNILKGKFKIVKKVSGKELVGKKYTMPFSNLPEQKGVDHKIIDWRIASGEDGTGMVHVAPGCGPEDYALGKKLKLKALSPLNEAGIYKDGYNELSGLSSTEASKAVLKILKENDFLYKVESIHHRYPHCWRCGTELVFRMVDEWYIKHEKIKKKLKDANKKIYWYPDYGKQRQTKWFDSMGDWLISRKRFWGLPLPIWECECGHYEVIGSMEELKEKAIKGFDKVKEIHRPWIDNVIIKCSKCNSDVKRVPDVGDAWLDAGITPFSTIGPYLENKKEWKKWFPIDFVTENLPGQYRGWFNALFWSSMTLENSIPFKSLLGYEMVKDETGREMHKSWGNAINAREALENAGADPLRWTYCLHNPTHELLFGFKLCENRRKSLILLFNTLVYLKTYFKLNNMKPDKSKIKNMDVASKWILSRLETTKKIVTDSLNELKPHIASNELQNFYVNDLSRFYGQVIRQSIKPEAKKEKRECVLNVFYKCFYETTKLLAPFTPFITEYFYQDFFKDYENEKSIHHQQWPTVEKSLINKKLEKNMKTIMNIIEASNSLRLEKKIRLKYPLQKLIINGEENILKPIKCIPDLLKLMTNVKEISTNDYVSNYSVKLNFKVAGKKFGKDVKEVAKLVASSDPNKLKEEIEKGTTKIKNFSLEPEDLLFTSEYEGDGKQFSGGFVELDTKVSPELKNEWLESELKHAIQSARKTLSLSISDKIFIYLPKELKQFENNERKVGSGGEKFIFEFEGNKYTIGVEKA